MFFLLFSGKLDFREHLFIFWDRKDRKSRKKDIKKDNKSFVIKDQIFNI